MRRSLPYLLLAAVAGLALPATSHAQYVLRTRFFTVQFVRQAPPTVQPIPASPQPPPPPAPLDPGAPPPVPETLPPSPQPLPPGVEQPLPPPQPVQGPLPPAPLPPVGPPAVVPPTPVPPPPAAVTPAQFVKTFQPLPGNYEVALIHPYTGCPVMVRFSLPPCPPKRVSVNKHRIEFSYRGHHDVVIRFLRTGGVFVRQ